MSPKLRSTRCTKLAGIALTALAVTGVTAPAASARTCPIDQNGDIVYLPDNSGNVFYIRVTNTTCATGNKVVRGFYRCRRANGRNGTCRKPVVGFTCRETKRRYTVLGGERLDFRTTATCSRGSRRVVFAYKQNLKGTG